MNRYLQLMNNAIPPLHLKAAWRNKNTRVLYSLIESKGNKVRIRIHPKKDGSKVNFMGGWITKDTLFESYERVA